MSVPGCVCTGIGLQLWVDDSGSTRWRLTLRLVAFARRDKRKNKKQGRVQKVENRSESRGMQHKTQLNTARSYRWKISPVISVFVRRGSNDRRIGLGHLGLGLGQHRWETIDEKYKHLKGCPISFSFFSVAVFALVAVFVVFAVCVVGDEACLCFGNEMDRGGRHTGRHTG